MARRFLDLMHTESEMKEYASRGHRSVKTDRQDSLVFQLWQAEKRQVTDRKRL